MIGINISFDNIEKKAEHLRRIVGDFDRKMKDEWWQNFPEDAYRVLNECEFGPLIATLCDEMINTIDAWRIPWWLHEKVGSLDPQSLLDRGIRDLLDEYFSSGHGQFPEAMDEKSRQEWLDRTSKHIENVLKHFLDKNTTPVRMFENREYPATEVYFMLRPLSGIGPKKASMILRDFLYRSYGISKRNPWFDQIVKIYPDFKVISGEHTLVPIDVHVVKVFSRIFGRRSGNWRKEQYEHWWDLDIQMFSRAVFPEFPARIDGLLWYVGSNYCKDKNPECSECIVQRICDSKL